MQTISVPEALKTCRFGDLFITRNGKTFKRVSQYDFSRRYPITATAASGQARAHEVLPTDLYYGYDMLKPEPMFWFPDGHCSPDREFDIIEVRSKDGAVADLKTLVRQELEAEFKAKEAMDADAWAELHALRAAINHPSGKSWQSVAALLRVENRRLRQLVRDQWENQLK